MQQKLWLDDVIVNVACKLLRQQFPDKKGLQSPLGGAIQILYIRCDHWVCIQVNQDKTLVEVYDSKYLSLPMAAVDQILQLIQTEQDSVTITCKKM